MLRWWKLKGSTVSAFSLSACEYILQRTPRWKSAMGQKKVPVPPSLRSMFKSVLLTRAAQFLWHLLICYLAPDRPFSPREFGGPAGAGRASLGRLGWPEASRPAGSVGPARPRCQACVCMWDWHGKASQAVLASLLKNKKSKMSKCQKWPPQRPFLTL